MVAGLGARKRSSSSRKEEDLPSKKRRPESCAFVDDAAEESDDEEEQEELPRKRRRPTKCAFVDDVADESNDEEEEFEVLEEEHDDDDGEEVSAEDVVASPARAKAVPPPRRSSVPAFLKPGQDDDEELNEDFFLKRYKRFGTSSTAAAPDDDDEEEHEEVPNTIEELLEDNVPRDGEKWWMLKCKPGQQQKSLLQRLEGKRDVIKKIVVPTELKGFVYVQAQANGFVSQAITRLPVTMSMVPPNEVRQALKMKQPRNTETGALSSWARVRTGTYKGDLCKIHKKVGKGEVMVLLVPRVNLAEISRKLDGYGKSSRDVPPQGFLDMNEFRTLKLDWRRNKQGFMVIDGTDVQMLENHVVKTISLKSLTTVVPTLKELERFEMHQPNVEGVSRKKGQLAMGDVVLVVEGDLKHLKGKVVKIDDTNTTVEVICEDLGRLTFQAKQLMKHFTAGDSVIVGEGMHKGTSGVVVKTLKDTLVILVSDEQEITVFIDLVQLNAHPEQAKIATAHDLARQKMKGPQTQEMNRGGPQDRKRFSGNHLKQDKKGQCVKVTRGQFKGFKGRVVENRNGTIRLELESQMRVVHVHESDITASDGKPIPVRGLEPATPLHPGFSCRTPMHPGLGCRTPMHDFGAPMLEYGFRTPVRSSGMDSPPTPTPP